MLSELWSDLRYRLRAFVHRAELERELDAELEFHIAHAAEAYERQGLPAGEARRRARLAFGSVEDIKERSREARGTTFLESVLQDLRYAWRGLRARPAFAVGVALTLALGIGANATMFGIVDRLLFRPPPYLRDPGRVHRVYLSQTYARTEYTERDASVARYLDLARWSHGFSAVAPFGTWRIAVGMGDATRELPVMGASVAYLGLFDARPALGRFFTADEDRLPTGVPVAVLGYAYWQVAFGGSRDVLGRELQIGRTAFTIIGVAPEGFVGLGDDEVPAVYVPFAAFTWNARPEDHTTDYHWQWLELAVRRAPGVSPAAATTDLTAALERSWTAQATWEPNRASVAAAKPRALLGPVRVQRGPLPDAAARVAVWVAGVALIVLLIACANVANLLLARAVTRRREIALRLALGVSRGRLIRQLVTESLLLAALGGLGGLMAAQSGGALIRRLFLPADVAAPVLGDGRTLAMTALATLAAALITGLAPAVHALRSDVARDLGAGGRDTDARASRLRTMLLTLQATLSVVLLIGAGLFVRSFGRVRDLRLGFDVDPVLVVTLNKRGVELSFDQQIALEQRLSDAALALPGVTGATPAATVPYWAYEGRALFVAGIDSVDLLGDFVMQAGNPDYFHVMGTRLVRGRGFDAADRAGAPPVVVVSAGMGRTLWPGRDPIGQCLRIGADTVPCTTVVGIAEDARTQSLSQPRTYTYYIPVSQFRAPTGMLLVRVAGRAEDHVERVRKGLQAQLPGAAYVTAQPFRDMVAPRMRSWQLGATMFVAFGGVALALAGIGLYGVIAYGVAERRREIGIRLALGAQRRQVLALVVRGGLRLIASGVVAGSVIAALLAQRAASLLFKESPLDPLVYVGVAGVLLLVAAVATWLPATAAARVDPSVTLRSD
ncbi:MAG TPA: ADOP family duplicated permease [Gemmatimonadales bacterium]|nr:ADOP family duplicated permease [Gemmatimonadales bacterium]